MPKGRGRLRVCHLRRTGRDRPGYFSNILRCAGTRFARRTSRTAYICEDADLG